MSCLLTSNASYGHTLAQFVTKEVTLAMNMFNDLPILICIHNEWGKILVKRNSNGLLEMIYDKHKHTCAHTNT